MNQLFGNMPPVVKNLLILNILFFIATYVFANRGVDLQAMLGLHHFTSDEFEPYQLITSMFMHGGLFHIFANMLGLVMFGSNLERHWGAKKFLTFYFIAGFSAVIFKFLVNVIILAVFTGDPFLTIDGFYQYLSQPQFLEYADVPASQIPAAISRPAQVLLGNGVGASGAIFGLLAAYYKYFPNTELLLYFVLPIKIKIIFPILLVMSLYLGIKPIAGDNIDHIAHLGGALGGLITVLIWQRNKNRFY